MSDYKLLDSGNLKKLEKIGPYTISRPSFNAVWQAKLDEAIYNGADLVFTREKNSIWKTKSKIDTWQISVDDVLLKLKLTDFGHIGFFPEHLFLCKKIKNYLKNKNDLNILNLFAYTGMATCFAAKSGAKVTHVDASKPSILWAKENSQLNNISTNSVRWILDDAMKFMRREVKRGSKYDGIILDPPSFGRGAKGEIFNIEESIFELLELCKKSLKDDFLFLIFSCHTPGFTKVVMENLMDGILDKKTDLFIDEMTIPSDTGLNLPSGFYAIWENL